MGFPEATEDERKDEVGRWISDITITRRRKKENSRENYLEVLPTVTVLYYVSETLICHLLHEISIIHYSFLGEFWLGDRTKATALLVRPCFG